MTAPSFDDVYARRDGAAAGCPRNLADERGAAPISPYMTALTAPTSLLVGASHDRPDVATVAILGYN